MKLGTSLDDANFFDDKIEEWHTGDSKQTLAEYLGMTPEQYAAYVENGLTTKRVTPAVVEGQNVEQQAEEENV